MQLYMYLERISVFFDVTYGHLLAKKGTIPYMSYFPYDSSQTRFWNKVLIKCDNKWLKYKNIDWTGCQVSRIYREDCL